MGTYLCASLAVALKHRRTPMNCSGSMRQSLWVKDCDKLATCSVDAKNATQYCTLWGALGRFSEKETSVSQDGKQEVLKKHRAYVIYGDVRSWSLLKLLLLTLVQETPVDDNWSAKSIVDYGDDLPFDDNGQTRRVCPQARLCERRR